MLNWLLTVRPIGRHGGTFRGFQRSHRCLVFDLCPIFAAEYKRQVCFLFALDLFSENRKKTLGL